MSSPYDSSRSRRRGLLTYWVPVALTVTVATVGIAAWAWSTRNDEEDEEEEEHLAAAHADYDYENADYGDNPPYGANNREGHPMAERPPVVRGPSGNYGVTDAPPPGAPAATTTGWSNQMSGALRRTPSPQQFLSNAGKAVAAGVAGVGTAVGSALSAIREEDKNAFADHETWSEEAMARRDKSASQPKNGARRRKNVAVIVSADTRIGNPDEDTFHEHASVLSHIPRNMDFSKIKLFVLIYAPGLKEGAVEEAASTRPPPSLSSSFSYVGHEQAQSPGEDGKNPQLSSNSANPAFNAVYSQALTLVEKDTMVMPYTSSNGHVHILRHLSPDVVYLQESLAGEDGSVVKNLQTWLRHDIILVVGADGGHGGLADSESEAERPSKSKSELWWHREDRVGRGRGVVVVDSLRLGDDWDRRVQGKE